MIKTIIGFTLQTIGFAGILYVLYRIFIEDRNERIRKN